MSLAKVPKNWALGLTPTLPQVTKIAIPWMTWIILGTQLAQDLLEVGRLEIMTVLVLVTPAFWKN